MKMVIFQVHSGTNRKHFLDLLMRWHQFRHDKPVVLYCGTGHNSGFATAYLSLFGYNASTLRYGNNRFMYDKMVNQRTALSWVPFTKEDVNNFDVVK